MSNAEAQSDYIDLRPPPTLQMALRRAIPLLGLPEESIGASSMGWSRLSTFQRCPWLYRAKYVGDDDGVLLDVQDESKAKGVGSLLHLFLGMHHGPEGTPWGVYHPEALYNWLLDDPKAPMEIIAEAWRVYNAYVANYEEREYLTPLAIERAAENAFYSCRYDMIARVDVDVLGIPKGTFIIETKSTSRFDAGATSWGNDGEILGQILLWKDLGLDKIYGPLAGVIVNLLGKQKVPLFRRLVLPIQSWQVEAHRKEIQQWQGLQALYSASGIWPRARQSCIGRWGLCDLYDSCKTGEAIPARVVIAEDPEVGS